MCNCGLALGTFDGLHEGHRRVLSAACLETERAVAVTFRIPPSMQQSGECELLMTPKIKNDTLEALGFEVKTLSFNDVCDLDPNEYLKSLYELYRPDRICCGFNYTFGKNAAGSTELLKEYCKIHGIEAVVVPAQMEGGEPVSSSRIRALLRRGDVTAANEMLGYQFTLSGIVANGAQRGRKIGLPTANFGYPEGIVMLESGVYASSVTLDGKKYPAVTYVGRRPTFITRSVICETHIVGFQSDIYGKNIDVRIAAFLRPEHKFSGLDELKNAIKLDIKHAKELQK